VVGGKRGVVCRWGGCVVCGWSRCVVCRLGRSMVGCHLVVVGSALVGHLGDVPIHVVSCVMHVLGPAVRQGNRVGACDCSMFVRALASVIGGLGVVVGHCIFVAVRLRWLLVVWLRGVVDWLGWCMVHRLRWCVVCWGVDNRGMMHHWSMDHGSMVYSMVSHGCMMDCSVVYGSMMKCSVMYGSVVECSMVYGSVVDSSVVNRGMMDCSVVDRGVMNQRGWGMVDWGRRVVRLGSMIRLRSEVWLGGVVHYGSVVGLWCVVVRKGGRSVDPNDGLLVASVAVDGLRRSCWLAVDQRVDGAMGFVHRHVHRGRVALFERLVMALVGGGNGSAQ